MNGEVWPVVFSILAHMSLAAENARMPTLSSMQIPPPVGWKEFEEITLTCLKIKWQSPNLSHHGRQGQRQDGIDIHGPDELGREVGVQCKLQGELALGTVEAEVVKAEAFTPTVSAFYMATSAPSDATLQREVRRISGERVAAGKFPIGIFFWEDLIQELVKNQEEFSKHYPEIHLRDQPQGSRLLSVLDITYYGLYLRGYMQLIFGEAGWMSGEDPYQIQRLLMTISACGAVLFDSARSKELSDHCDKLTEYCLAFATGKEEKPEGWEPAIGMANSVEAIVSTLQYSLSGSELVVFRLGQFLAHWYLNSSAWRRLSENREANLREFFEALGPDEAIRERLNERIARHYADADAEKIEGGDSAHDIFNLVRSMILRHEMKS